ncbi:unnamed protein product [Natator depressus]
MAHGVIKQKHPFQMLKKQNYCWSLLIYKQIKYLRCNTLKLHLKLSGQPVLDSKYPHLRKVAFNILSTFGSTYVCELAFSTMNNIQSHNCFILTDNQQCNCLSCID